MLPLTLRESASFRPLCLACRRPLAACYCPLIKPFESRPRFVILTQPREARHRFGTGRMASLCMTNSLLIEGVDFSDNPIVNAILRDRKLYAVVLYPGASSINLSELSEAQRAALSPSLQELVVFVLDGTWKTARKMIRLSRNLVALPSIRLNPPMPSNYCIRKQPQPHCLSTLEAIHHVIHLLAPAATPDAICPRPYDNLLEVFDFTIHRQLSHNAR